ncbi:MAG: methylated-DNA--[protein]-cysteine S-methyltransferase [Bdellovibrio sp.]|nr:methylated-DNA--[protein]-cysteine S-methyltransferase [Bdellovibrio sp.]
MKKQSVVVEHAFSSTDVKTPVGKLKIVMHGKDLAGITWPKDKRKFDWDKIKAIPESKESKTMAQDIEKYFKTKKMKKKIWTSLVGTDLQLAVWKELLDIPFGATVSYSDLAKSLKKPKAVRAIASAIAKNPVSVLIPCHRVVGKDTSLTGFAGGLKAKKWLINWEAENNKTSKATKPSAAKAKKSTTTAAATK